MHQAIITGDERDWPATFRPVKRTALTKRTTTMGQCLVTGKNHDGDTRADQRPTQPRIAYIVHDVNDAAVARRVTMLRAGGADVTIAGFHRDERTPVEIAGAKVVTLGRTADSKLTQRALMVFRNLLRPAKMLDQLAGADVIMARNLESLILAVRVRRALPNARLVYECLDIHRSLLGASAVHRAIQQVETRLLRSIDLLIVSSPAFVREYFARKPGFAAPTLLLENKLLTLDRLPVQGAPPAGPPWTIGWFGNLRCARTFSILAAIAAGSGGRVNILIAGRASPAVFDDFEAMVTTAPYCTYVGPYAPADLGQLYAQCHFAWAIDYFEEGLNSSWLLPNRLYEASSFGAVPIALQSVETGRWLARHDAGLLIGDGDGQKDLGDRLGEMSMADYADMRAKIAKIPREDLIADITDCQQLLSAVAGR